MAYIVEPGQLVGLRIGLYNALEVGIVTFLDVVRIELGTHAQQRGGRVCKGQS